MAGDEDYGSARITLDLDESGAVREATAIGAEIERALTRATRNIGRGILGNIQRSLRGTDLSVRVTPDLSRFESQLRSGLRRLRDVTVPVTADMRAFQRSFRRGGASSVDVPVTPDTRGFARALNRSLRRVRAEIEVRGNTRNLVRQIERELRRVRPPRITVQVDADVSRIQSRLRSLDVPRIEATVTLDVDRIEAQLRELASRDITIPITLGTPGGGGDLGGGLLDSLRGSLGGGAALGAGFGAAAMGGIRAALTAAGPWGAIAAGVAAAAAVVGKALMTGIEGVIEHQQLAGTLRANLGLSDAEANQVGRVVGQLYARGVTESVEDGTRAVQAALRAGLAAPDDLPGLEKISTAVSDLGSMMEEDVGKVARAVGQMVKTGLVDNASEGVDLLTKSVQQGGNVAEDLLDTFTEYPTQFRQLGLSAEEAFGLIQQGLRNGARDSDIIADTLKEFSIEAAQGGKRVVDAFNAMNLDAGRLTDAFAQGGPAAREALDEVFDALQQIEDPLERNQAAVGLFGTKAEDMAGALASLDLDTAAKEMEGFGGAAAKAGDDLRDNLGNRLETIGREAKQAFQGIFTGDFSQFADLKTAIQEALPDLKETGKHLVENIGQAITEYGPKAFEAAFKIAFAIGERVDIWGPLLLKLVVGAAALPAVIGGLILTALGGALAGIGSKLLPYLETAWNGVVNFFTQTVPRWGSQLGETISGALRGAWERATGALSGAASRVGEFFSDALERARSAVSTGIDRVVEFFTQLPGRIVSGLAALPGMLLEAFTSAVAFVIIGLLTVVAGLVFVFTELPVKIYNGLLSLGSFLVSAFVSGFNAVTSTVGGWITTAVGWFAALPGRVWSALQSFGSFLVRAFVNGFNATRSTVSGWITSTVNFIRNLPSRASAALSSLGSSLQRAVSSGFDRARTATVNGVTAVVNYVRGLPGKIGQALSSLGSRFTSAFNTAKNAATRAVSGLITGVVNLFRGLGSKIVGAMGDIGSQIMNKVKSGIPSSVRKYLPFADGGIVYGPTHALIGEAGPEVVIPLTKPKRAAALAARSGLLDMLGVTQVQALAAPDFGGTAAVNSGVASLRKTLTSLAALLDGIGANVVAGMVDGIRGNTGALAGAAEDMALVAIDSAKGTLGIASPSKVFAQIGKDTGAGFVKGLTGTESQIKSTADKVVRSIEKAFEKLKKSKYDDWLIHFIERSTGNLQRLAKEREAIAKRIEEANKYATDTANAARSAFSLQNLAQGQEQVTAKSLAAGLEEAVAKVRSFRQDIAKLGRRGLSKDLLEQLIGLGPEQGAQLAASLTSATSDSLKRLNSLQGQLSKESTALGRTGADLLFDAGKQAGAGFLTGLLGQRKAIEKAMLDIAKRVQATIRKGLKIKSPSRVMMQIGDLTAEGLRVGLLRSLSSLESASRSAARALASGVSSELTGIGATLAPGNVVPLTRAQGAAVAAPVGLPAALAGRWGGPAKAGTVINNTFEIREVGDAHVTAKRIVDRIAFEAGVMG